MKKLLVVALAALGMVACVNEEVTEMPQGGAITFENAFIDNATRAAVDPSITVATLDGFKVWGFVKEYDGVIFDGTEVMKTNGAWTYDGTQYWVPNQPYYFAALAPINGGWELVSKATGEDAKLGLGTVKFENEDGTEDLLYAKEMKQSAGLNEDNGAVKFQFQHLLSKVKFTFKNGFPTSTASIKVTNVKMTAPAEAKINLAQANYAQAWTDYANTTTLAFGDVEKLASNDAKEAAYERFTIPAVDKTYTITFDVELFMGAQSVYTVSKTSTVSGYELEMGTAYNFTAEITPENLDLEEIVFDVEKVDGWVPEGGEQVDLPVAMVNGVAYANFEEAWAAAVAAGKELTLTENVTLDADNTLAITAGNSASLDLNGKTLTVTSNDNTETRAAKSGNREMFLVKGTMNVKGGTIIYKHEGANMGWNAMTTVFNITAGGVVNIENATIKNLGGSDMNFVAHLNNWGEATLNVDNSTLEATYVAVRVFNSGHDMNNVKITNSHLKGGRCFWVHNWTAADFGSEEKAAAQQALIDYEAAVLKGTNTFEYTKAAVRLGMTNSIELSESGIPFVDSTETFNEAISEAKDGDVVVLTEGEYTMPSINNKEVTIKGDESVVITVGKPNMTGGDVNFEGITIKGSGYSTGVQHANTVTYKDVKVVGAMCLYGEKVVFDGCSFELVNDYIWCYGAKEVEFINCEFNTTGKAILVYNEGAGANKVTVTGCKFNASAGAKAGAIANQNCAAIEIDNYQSSGVGVAHNVTATNNTYSENFSGEWRIKNYVAGNAITVNGAEYSQIALDGKLMTIDADKNVTVLQ